MESNALAYDAMIVFTRIIASLFFREIRPRGTFNIPREGPVIFVAGPHNNQASTYVINTPKDTPSEYLNFCV
jgi:1-acyl-sn-glycerol-3-phosphate acyltransferase